jgi:hypothetical protein
MKSIGTIFTQGDLTFKLMVKQKLKMYEASLFIQSWSKKGGVEGVKWVEIACLMTYQNNLEFLKSMMLDKIPNEEAL